MTPLHRKLHRQLMEVAVASATTGRFGSVYRLLRDIDDPSMLSQIHRWLLAYSPLIDHPTEPGKFIYSREAKLRFDKQRADENPFWLSDRSANARSQPTATLGRARPHRKDSETSAEAPTEKEIAKHHLRSALSRFMSHPTYANRENLQILVLEYQNKYLSAESPDFVRVSQGGLPSLGKGSR